MAEINPPLYVDQDASYGAAELGLPYRDIMGEGVVGANDLKVTAGTGLKSSVAAGAAWVAGDDNADAQPTYRVRNDAAVLLQHDAADATNPRIDLVIVQVLDSAFSGVSKLWRLALVKGTPAASPAAPALPNDAITLAQVTIPAGSGTLGTITDKRTRAKVGSGAAQASGGAQLVTALPSSPQDGDEVILADSTTAPTYSWHLKYLAAASEWLFIGGTPMFVKDVTNADSTTSTALVDPAHNLAFTLPRAGKYLVEGGGQVSNSGGTQVKIGCNVGGTDSAVYPCDVAGASRMTAFAADFAGVTASAVVKLRFAVGDGSGTLQKKWLKVTPVALT